MAEMIMDGIIALNQAKKYTAESLDGLGALKGANCVIESIDTVPEGNRVTFSWTGTDGTIETSTMIVENGIDGNNGANGADGVGISKIEKIDTVGLEDTYRITFTNNTTYDYSVTNGQKGEQGIQGIRGEKGEQGEQGVQGIQGIKGEKGDDGYPFLIYKEYSDISEFNKNDFPEIGLMFMIVADGASSFPVYRYTGDDTVPYRYVTDLTGGEGIKGEKGDKGEQGEQGVQGENGKDGITYIPTIGTVTSGDIASATVVTKDETSTAEFSFVLPKGDNVTVDAILSNTSENPVQNKVVKQAIDNKADKSLYGDTTINVGRKAGTDVGNYSTAEGTNTTASGYSSHAEGTNTTASGGSSHAEGVSTTASGYSSHAEGHSTTASGHYSHAGGKGTKALHTSEVAFGTYNESNDNTLFSIGDGTANDARHNAFEITTNGGKLHDKDIATMGNISNPNLLINPDFKINQRGISGTFSDTGKYFVDRWRLVSGTVTVNSDGTLTLNGSICQPLENAVGLNVTASVSAGTAVYDDTAKTFTITGNGDVISWAKLEIGCAATAFTPPDPATELLKCRRYYRTLDRGTTAYSYDAASVVFVLPFDTPMRNVMPSMTILNTAEMCWSGGWLETPEKSALSIMTYNINHLGICYIQVGGFNVTNNGVAFPENYSFRLGSDNFIGIDAEIY